MCFDYTRGHLGIGTQIVVFGKGLYFFNQPLFHILFIKKKFYIQVVIVAHKKE